MGPVTSFSELFFVSSFGKSGCVDVWIVRAWREECEEGRVSRAENNFVEKAENGDVASEGRGGEVMCKKSLAWSEVQVVEKGIVCGVECAECNVGCVV